MLPRLAPSFRKAIQSAGPAGAKWIGGLAAGGGLALLGVGTAVSLAEAEPAAPIDPWNRALGYWESTKKALGLGTSWWGGSPGSQGPIPLPTDKLRCAAQPYVSESGAPIGYHPVVLVACGSFNPPTIAHLRMMELARDALTARGYDVMGGYLSPVSDAYWKQALAPGAQRVALARAAAADSDFIMVDAWEAAQPRYTRTLVVLQRVATELARLFEAPEADAASGGVDPRHPAAPQRPRLPAEAAPAPAPRSVLVCGADVLESMADPQLWQQDLLERLLAEHGVVCISRGAVETAQLLERPGTLLNAHRANITIVQEPVPNEISSSLIRQELANGRSVKYLVPEAALALIYDRGLYGSAGPVARAGTALHTGR